MFFAKFLQRTWGVPRFFQKLVKKSIFPVQFRFISREIYFTIGIASFLKFHFNWIWFFPSPMELEVFSNSVVSLWTLWRCILWGKWITWLLATELLINSEAYWIEKWEIALSIGVPPSICGLWQNPKIRLPNFYPFRWLLLFSCGYFVGAIGFCRHVCVCKWMLA